MGWTQHNWIRRISRRMFGGNPLHEAAGAGRRSFAWLPSNPGAVAAMTATQTELRTKSRDLVRRNAWANAALESYVANAIGTGIKPQSLVTDSALRERIQALWRDWTLDADYVEWMFMHSWFPFWLILRG